MFLVKVIDTFFYIVYWMILIRTIVSWVRPTVRDRTVIRLLHVLYDVTEPILEPIRRLLPNSMAVDFSPFIAIILMEIIKSVLYRFLF